MSEVDVEQLHELLVRARAICELLRVATQCEVVEALRPKTVETSLLMVEDLFWATPSPTSPLCVSASRRS